MVYRWIMKSVLANEKFLKKVADSFLVKVAAQVTAYFVHRGKEVGRKKIKNMYKSIDQKDPGSSKSKSGKSKVKPAHVLKSFSEAFKEQWKQEELKRQQKKLAKKAKKAKKLQEGNE
ncbi:unnamed protein product [Candidula unifasciata]|uniref:Uncharacterized protein n=1 Tax=Candidula unifasciata TaxID=100452 RepID=A0A8S3Z8F5_9EUPU|nr:unnamed protein product [Candidula unifasciata]